MGLPASGVIIVYGATGDLARRWVLPALLDMASRGLLPERYRIIGSGRGDLTEDEFRRQVHDAITEYDRRPSEAAYREFATRLSFAGGGFTAGDPGQLPAAIDRAGRSIRAEAVTSLREQGEAVSLRALSADGGDEAPPLLHYLAVPPSAFGDIVDAIGTHGLAERSRVVFEKPFGTDAASFKELQEQVNAVLDETQVFRLDHFLAKEAVRGLPALRLSNPLLARSWHRDAIEAVQIDAPETLDVANRGGFYDGTGAFLDMLVTHLFQVAAAVAMEPPDSLDPAEVAEAREAVFADFRPLARRDVTFGQYHGYTAHPGVPSHSATETFAAARLWIDNDRWRGVPFLLRSGKAMGLKGQQIGLLLKGGSTLSFSMSGPGGLQLSLVAPEADTIAAEAAYPEALGPYARLINDALAGRRGLFTGVAGLEKTWEVAAPILDDPPVPVPYQRGTMGPPGGNRLAGPRGWLLQSSLPSIAGSRHGAPRRSHRRSNGRGGNGPRLRAVQ
jgi:glucose-6-phosphate 1-dehydrogenase